MAFFTKFFQSFTPTVRAEEEEEAELVDPQTVLREKCTETAKCSVFHQKLNSCNDRVNSRSKTEETCVEEVIDYMNCVDHCVAKTLFHKLK